MKSNWRIRLAWMLAAVALVSQGATAQGTGAGEGTGRPRPKIRIVLVGDSTVTDKDGWGPGFAKKLTPDAECINMARGGRSSRSYMDEGAWRKALEQKGDYVLIQFGHNDQPGKGPERETDPDTTYQEFLARYVADARRAGAKPVLVTSLARRRFGPDGKLHSDLGAYAEAMRRVAEREKVPLVDLHALSLKLLNEVGPSGADRLGKMKPDGKGGEVMDYTHLGPEGSAVFGAMVAAELSRVVPALAPYIRK